MKKYRIIHGIMASLAILSCLIAVNSEATIISMGDEQWFVFNFSSSFSPFNGINANGFIINPDAPPALDTWTGELEIYDDITDSSPTAWLSSPPYGTHVSFNIDSTLHNAGLFDDYVLYMLVKPTSWLDASAVAYSSPLDIEIVALLYYYIDASNYYEGQPITGRPINPVPDPPALLLLGLGLVGLAGAGVGRKMRR